MKSKWESEKENLELLILVKKLSYEEIGRRYGCTGSNIKKVASRLGIELPIRRIVNQKETFNKDTTKSLNRVCLNCGNEFKPKSGYTNKYCSNKCALEYKHKQLYRLILNEDPSIMRANYSPKNFREDIIKEQGGVCDICKRLPEWERKPLVFIIDHIDGNAANNSRSNLRAICPNCDSQLDTYKSKNKNGARSYYRYHKFDEETKIGK